ncbi:MAG: four helix bundle protein [Bacteroidales bacterium]|nr:four helix bundle protein [Bacteroidales bacterium]
MSISLLQEKSLLFAVRCVNLYKHLTTVKNEYILSKQMLRSGTSIGANVTESRAAQSDADFISKNAIALKEANETLYWFKLLNMTDYLDEKEYLSLSNDLTELIAMLTSTIKKKKDNQDK